MTAQQKYQHWLQNCNDPQVQMQLQQLQGKDNDIANAFYCDLEFGTAGLRAAMGAGSNCLNIYTVRKATQGVATVLLSQGNTQRRVAISYDSRHNSLLFAKTTAEVLASVGIKCYITKTLAPTPFLAYATKTLNCDVGVMITASHNSKEYNGYKLFDARGTQFADTSDIATSIKEVNPFDISPIDFESLLSNNMIEYIQQSLFEQYLQCIKDTVQSPSVVQAPISIVYTPLNGAGFELVPNILRQCDFDSITSPKEQATPNGDFATCPYPNPENVEALRLGIECAKTHRSDLVIATDPDCDRVGVVVRHKDKYHALSGNELGVLLADFLLSQGKAQGTLVGQPIIISTIVSTSLVDKIAMQYGAKVIKVLTGFKYIGQAINQLELQNQADKFLLGFEESMGYLVGVHVRDKDAVVASALIAKMVSYYKTQSISLVDRLNAIYGKFGFYTHATHSYKFEGQKGADKIKHFMQTLRANTSSVLGDCKVSKCIDYLQDDINTANVLQYCLDDGSTAIIRPSGTEPTIKLYLTAIHNQRQNDITVDKLKQAIDQLLCDN